MSVLAGFDFVAEASNSTIMRMIKSTVQIGTQSIIPPFELSYSLGVYTIHLIVNDVQLDLIKDDLIKDDKIRLTLFFDNTSLIAPQIKSICPLNGTIKMEAPIQLSISETIPHLSFRKDKLLTAIDYSQKSKDLISKQLGDLISLDDFIDLGDSLLTGFTQENIQNVEFPLKGITIVPNEDGMIGEKLLQFEKLEVHCIEDADREKQALVFLGVLFLKNHDKANHFEKTSTSIVPGRDVCLSISADVIHNWIMPPVIWEALGGIMKCSNCGFWYKPIDGYPNWECLNCGYVSGPNFEDLDQNWTCPGCGAGKNTFINIKPKTRFKDIPLSWRCPKCGANKNAFAKVIPPTYGNDQGIVLDELEGANVMSINESLGDGVINIHGNLEKSGTCYSAQITLDIEANLVVKGPVFEGNIQKIDVHGETQIDWWCRVLLGLVGVPYIEVPKLWIQRIVDIAINKFFIIPDNPLVSGFWGVTITNEALTLQGYDIYGTYGTGPSSEQKELRLHGSVTISSRIIESTGEWKAKIFCEEEEDIFPFIEYSQQQMGTYSIESKLLPIPLKVDKFELSYYPTGQTVELVGSSGIITLNNVHVYFTTPIPDGWDVYRDVTIAYSISDNVVQLSNNLKDGNYSVSIHAYVVDCLGKPIDGSKFWQPWYGPYISSTVNFYGNAVEIGNNFTERFQACIANTAQKVAGIAGKEILSKEAPRWVEVDFPAPEELNASIRELMILGIPKAKNILVQSKLAHGSSFYRAIFSQSVEESGRDFKAIQLQSAIKEIEANISKLAKQLSEISDDLGNQVGRN